MNLKNIYTVLLLLFSTTSYCQELDEIFLDEDENIIYKKEWSLGARFHTNAVSAFYEQVWIKDIKKRHLFQAGLLFYVDLRDKKTTPLGYESSAAKYFFGKKNDFFGLQILYGNRTVIANKSETSGVKLSFTYYGGVTLGVLKPYYLKFQEIETKRINGRDVTTIREFEDRYSMETEDIFLNKISNTVISGEGSITKGLENLSFTPALTAKVGLNFDFARKSKLVTSLEVGSELDLFYKNVDIYISDRNLPYILNLYLSMQMGMRR